MTETVPKRRGPSRTTARQILAALARIEAVAKRPIAPEDDGYARQLGRLEMRVELEVEAIRKLLEGRT